MEISTENPSAHSEQITYFESFQNTDFKNDYLAVAVDGLSEKEIFILDRIYIDENIESEVSKILRVAQQTVNYHKKLALNKLRNGMAKAKETSHRI